MSRRTSATSQPASTVPRGVDCGTRLPSVLRLRTVHTFHVVPLLTYLRHEAYVRITSSQHLHSIAKDILPENRLEDVPASEQNWTVGISTFAPSSTTPMSISIGLSSLVTTVGGDSSADSASASAAESDTTAARDPGVVGIVRPAWLWAVMVGSWLGAQTDL